MRTGILFIGIAAVMMVGCSKPADTVYTDLKGNSVVKTGEGDNSTTTYKGADGTEMKVTKEGVQIQNGKGQSFTSGSSQITEAELGMPYYPGSAAEENRDIKVDADGKKSWMSVRTTADDSSKVIEFYKDKLAKVEANGSVGDMSSLAGTQADGKKVSVVAMKESGKTTITITLVDEGKKP